MSSCDSEFSEATCPYQTPHLIQVNVYSFFIDSCFSPVNIAKFKPAVVRYKVKRWYEKSHICITWDPAYLGGDNQRVTVQLARFSMKSDRQVAFHSTFNVVAGQQNDGNSQFVVPNGVDQG